MRLIDDERKGGATQRKPENLGKKLCAFAFIIHIYQK